MEHKYEIGDRVIIIANHFRSYDGVILSLEPERCIVAINDATRLYFGYAEIQLRIDLDALV